MRVQSPVTFFISTFFQQHLIRMLPRQRNSLVVGVCNIHPAAIQHPSVEQWIDTDIYLWRPGNKWNNTWLPFSWIETFEQHMHVTKGTITWLCYCYSRRRPNPFWEYSLFLISSRNCDFVRYDVIAHSETHSKAWSRGKKIQLVVRDLTWQIYIFLKEKLLCDCYVCLKLEEL
jgi:hypothetical protein